MTPREFVRAKKYKTDAEKYEWSFVFEDFVPEEMKDEIPERIQARYVFTYSYQKGFPNYALMPC